MGANGNGRTTEVWKWISALLVTVLLAGSPGIIYALRSPSPEKVEQINDRQQLVLQRLAAIEVRLTVLEERLADLEAAFESHRQFDDNSNP